MRPIERIRRSVFDVSQTVFGEIAGTTQASISRWEKGGQKPSLDEMARIRAAARARNIEWDDRWFFEIPETSREENAA